MGLECPRPGIGVRHRMFSPVSPSHLSGRSWPSETPEACGPRNDGQLPDKVLASEGKGELSPTVRTMRRSATTSASPSGRHLLPSRIIRRGTHSSDTSSRLRRVPATRNRYRPGPSHPPGPSLQSSSTSVPSLFQAPPNDGHPSPSSMNVRSEPNRATKPPNSNGVEGSCSLASCVAGDDAGAFEASTPRASATANPTVRPSIAVNSLPGADCEPGRAAGPASSAGSSRVPPGRPR